MKRIKFNPVRSALLSRVSLVSFHHSLLALGITWLSLVTPLQAAELKLASFFGDHMVLQRERAVCVWGEGEPNTPIKVSVATQEASATVRSEERPCRERV